MKTQTLSISDILRFANHDFLNQIQIIKMYLDMDKIEEAKSIIATYSEQSRTLSNINRLKLPKTVEWLQTVQWRYPALQISIKSNVNSPVDMKKDELIVEYLEKTVIHVYDRLDPFTEQQLDITIESNDTNVHFLFDLTGKWEETQLFKHEENDNLHVQTYEQTATRWKYALNMEQE